MTKTNYLYDEDFSEQTGQKRQRTIDGGANDFGQEHDDASGKDGAEEADSAKDSVLISKSKVVLIKKLLENIRENNEKITKLLSGSVISEEEARISIGQLGEIARFDGSEDEEEGGRIVEGVFDGENMIGPDGKQYSVPANYASKSKLIEGDILKLTITPTGTFMYKQIGPIDRARVVGILEQSENGNFLAVAGNKKWKVLTASVTYYKGQEGDEVVILVPKASDSNWAAVENIVRKEY